LKQHRLQSLILIRGILAKEVSHQQQKEPAVARLSAPNKHVKRTVKIDKVTSDVGEAVEATQQGRGFTVADVEGNCLTQLRGLCRGCTGEFSVCRL
jgi:ribosomal protein L13E